MKSDNGCGRGAAIGILPAVLLFVSQSCHEETFTKIVYTELSGGNTAGS